jgi:hypothetical protein
MNLSTFGLQFTNKISFLLQKGKKFVKLDEEVNGNIISFGDYFKGSIPFKEMLLKLVMHFYHMNCLKYKRQI